MDLPDKSNVRPVKYNRNAYYCYTQYVNDIDALLFVTTLHNIIMLRVARRVMLKTLYARYNNTSNNNHSENITRVYLRVIGRGARPFFSFLYETSLNRTIFNGSLERTIIPRRPVLRARKYLYHIIIIISYYNIIL